MKFKLLIQTLSILLFGFFGAYAQSASEAIVTQSYGRNMLRVFPLRVMDAAGIGLGIDYERIIGKKQNLGLVLPLTYIIGYNNGDNESERSFLYFSPGLKIYPFGQRRVNYAVGPSLFFGYSEGIYKEAFYPGKAPSYVEEQRLNQFRFGVFANNYLNIQLNQHYSFGVEVGLGVRYIDLVKLSKEAASYNKGFVPTGNFAMNFGYRF